MIEETPRMKSLTLDLPSWRGHRAGQHVDIRLTSADGYQAQRSYSIASAPEDDRLMLTIERLDDGEVSPYLTDVIAKGDGFELRGPIGGYRLGRVRVWATIADRPGAQGSCRCARYCAIGRPPARRLRCVCCTPRGHLTT